MQVARKGSIDAMSRSSISATTTACLARLAPGLAPFGLAGLVVLGSAGVPAVAQEPSPPQSGQLYAGCVLSTGESSTIEHIEDDIAASSGGAIDPEVSFIVVYSVPNTNNGQVVPESFVTGPVVCINPDEVTISETTEDTQLSEVDLKSADEALILRYTGTGEFTLPNDRFCHTVNDRVDCVDINLSGF